MFFLLRVRSRTVALHLVRLRNRAASGRTPRKVPRPAPCGSRLVRAIGYECTAKTLGNNHEAGRRVIASHYREAVRLAGFMQGSRAGMKHEQMRIELSRLAWEFPKPRVEWSVWPGRPRGGERSRISGQTKKRSGAADLGIHQGSFLGGAKSCRVWRRSLSRGSQSRQVLARGDGGNLRQARGLEIGWEMCEGMP